MGTAVRTRWRDRALGSDPGLTRLRSAGLAAVVIGVAMLAEWAFVHRTQALWLPADSPALIALPPAQRAATLAAQHHAITVVAIMLGAIVGLISSFASSMFAQRRQLVLFTVCIPIPMTVGLAVGLGLGDHRALALTLLVLVLMGGAYARRIGPVGFLGGQLVFMGAFFGFNLHGQIAVDRAGWLVAEIALAAGVALLAEFTLFFPSRRRALRRMVRSYVARERDVATRALAVFDRPTERGAEHLGRRLTRLNEAALMIDAHLAMPGAVPATWEPAELHQRLFDSELALTNLARFARRLGAQADLPEQPRALVREALVGVKDVDLLASSRAARALLRELHRAPTEPAEATTRVLLHRFAVSVLGFVEAAERWRIATLVGSGGSHDAQAYTTDVTLNGGWLPGSAAVSAAASLEAGARRVDRIRLAPYTRISLQIGVAATLAILLGSWLSEQRFYFAVVATFVTFLGANNAGEQVRKGVLRVVGTVVGVFLGAVLVHLVGHHTSLTIVVVIVAMFFGLYLLRISYAFMTIGITITVSQLYVQLDEYSTSLLVLRLQETAIGAACAALTVLLVAPLRTGRVVRVATRQYLQALAAFVQAATSRLIDPAFETELRDAARQIDSAFQALTATLQPVTTPVVGQPDSTRKRIVQTVTASRHYARTLVVDAQGSVCVPAAARPALAHAAERLLCSLDELVAVGLHGNPGEHTYVRSAALFELVAAELGGQLVTSPAQLALRDLQLIDGTLASLAEGLGLVVTSLDTDPDTDTAPAADGRRDAVRPGRGQLADSSPRR